jgi:hypothetical protein
MKSIFRAILVTLALLFLASCATSAKRVADINAGMTKAEVVRILGTPDGSGLDGDKEYLNYRLMENIWTDWVPTSYTVVLQNGQVVSYGRHGQTN